MISSPSLLRRTFDGIALFAVLNLLVLVGLVAYCTGTGVVDGEKFRQIIAVIRAEPAPQAEATPTTPAENPESRRAGTEEPVGGDALAESQINREIMRREAERIKTELDQRLALNNSILLRVMTERERFRQEREATRKEDELASQEREQEGFKKQVEIFDSLSPKVALQNLLALSDTDQAADLLMSIETRKAKSIIEAAKREEDAAKMRTILHRMTERAPQRSAQLTRSEP